jgi:hypothetical protein
VLERHEGTTVAPASAERMPPRAPDPEQRPEETDWQFIGREKQ